jgi:2-polyprenyl-3-methyl-5-hydroxy-6-metoxy-1,4-benzoquinol methylase
VSDICLKMRADWDERARKNYRHYIVNSRTDWSAKEFRESGEETVLHYVDNDMANICEGKSPAALRVLDFGCGAGRVTRALAKRFGQVVGVDISSEMLDRARRELADVSNVEFVQSNGSDLAVLADSRFDFAFAFSVFHHIPDKAIIESCIREVGERLGTGSLFKFEVQGYLPLRASAADTWLGAAMSEAEMSEIADRSGFEYRYRTGAGEESFWQWFFKK